LPQPRRDRADRAESSAVADISASVALLADTASALQSFVQVFIYVYILLILAYVITSWIRLPYALHRVQRFLDDVCDPYIRLFRRILPSFGPLDLSPMVAVVSLVVIQRLLVALIGRLL
jgi:uncharacterized protein YggT (Ycf19 family)